jgi:hypothetical protein
VPTTPLLNVFVSHAHEECELAQLLKARIQSDFIGLIRVFVSSDHNSIRLGPEWLEEVVCELKQSSIFVFLCSEGVERRPWINMELGAALALDRKIIPVCHTDLVPDDLQGPLRDRQSIKASNARDLQRLYEAFADAIHSTVPKGDFESLAQEVRSFEETYASQKDTLRKSLDTGVGQPRTTRIAEPTVVCISSKQFQETAADELQMIRAAFPDNTLKSHVVCLNAAEVVGTLTNQSVDVIHVAAYVCNRGHIFFNQRDPTDNSCTATDDFLSSERFASLVEKSRASLVVVGNGEAIDLAARLVPVTNVVFATDLMDLKMLAKWIELFYCLLPQHSLAEACKKASLKAQAPMRLYPKLLSDAEVRFERKTSTRTTSAG